MASRGQAGQSQDKPPAEQVRVLRHILEQQLIYTVYQPIVLLTSRRILGFEALSRIPRGVSSLKIEPLLHLATAANLLLELDTLCRETALASAGALRPGQLLFINTEPEIVVHPRAQIAKAIQAHAINPNHVVLEITERTAIEDFDAFRKTLRYFKRLGCKVSVDDVGSGYATLQVIEELQPDFVKIGQPLVKGIEHDAAKQNLILAVLEAALPARAVVIAEGIETSDQYRAVIELGVQAGQGYLIGRPHRRMVDQVHIEPLFPSKGTRPRRPSP